MAATVVVNKRTGAAGATKTAVGTSSQPIWMNTQEAYGDIEANPIPSGSGTRYTFWDILRYEVTGSGGTVFNLRVWVQFLKALPTGFTLKIGRATAYDQATGTSGTSGDEASAAYVGLVGATYKDVVGNYDEEQKALVIPGIETLTGEGDEVAFGWIVAQITYNGSAGGAEIGPNHLPTFHFLYDES